MPITEIVRVLAAGGASDGARYELLYDVDGSMRPDEATLGWPRFWLRELRAGRLVRVHGPYDDEDEALNAGAGFGVTSFGPG